MNLSDLERDLIEAERAAREARGRPQWHLLDMAEFPFAFAQKELAEYTRAALDWAQREPANIAALSAGLYAELANRRYDRANEVMQKIVGAGLTTGQSLMRFGVPADVPAGMVLPPVHGSYPTGSALFLACDAKYFEIFGIPLLKSIAVNNIATPLHIHLMAKDSAIIDRIMASKGPMTVTATWEDPTAFITGRGIQPNFYYGAARLIRFSEALHHTGGALCMLDVDSIANGDPMSLLNRPGNVGARVRPGRLEPWNQFSACMVLGRAGGCAYFDRVANIVKVGLEKPWWGLDQYALFSAWVGLKPELTLFGPKEADITGTTAEGLFLFTAGAKKKTLLQDQTPYAQLFRKYR